MKSRRPTSGGGDELDARDGGGGRAKGGDCSSSFIFNRAK